MVKVTKIIEDTFDDLDNTLIAVKTKVFRVGKVDYEIDLCEENAERFDREFGFWINAARRVSGSNGNGAPKRGTLPTILPVPVRGEKWWEDPERPFSNETNQAFTGARRRLREYGRANGWPDLSRVGVIPGEIGDAWYDNVWATLDPQTWDELKRLEDAGGSPPKKRPPGRPPRTVKPPKPSTRVSR